MKLEKAFLKALDGGVPDIHFMFNPVELSFQHEVESSEENGARTEETGRPKISFSHIKARTITISNIMFDTYEEREDVQAYLRPFLCAVEFVKHVKKSNPSSSSGGGNGDDNSQEKTPIYRFLWGNQDKYLPYCIIERLDYKLTMFLPDGTPVRAVIDNLTLKETDGRPRPSLDSVKPDRTGDSIFTRFGV
ncbi:MAG: hypothetical protein VKK04_06420 [Synechococcales bacterium]|nr:hypothetical protein [Synechococcales bacterium]